MYANQAAANGPPAYDMGNDEDDRGDVYQPNYSNQQQNVFQPNYGNQQQAGDAGATSARMQGGMEGYDSTDNTDDNQDIIEEEDEEEGGQPLGQSQGHSLGQSQGHSLGQSQGHSLGQSQGHSQGQQVDGDDDDDSYGDSFAGDHRQQKQQQGNDQDGEYTEEHDEDPAVANRGYDQRAYNQRGYDGYDQENQQGAAATAAGAAATTTAGAAATTTAGAETFEDEHAEYDGAQQDPYAYGSAVNYDQDEEQDAYAQQRDLYGVDTQQDTYGTQYGQSQPYGQQQYGQSQQYGQQQRYGQQQDPYASYTSPYGTRAEQARPQPQRTGDDEDYHLRKNIAAILAIVIGCLIVAIIIALVALILFLNDDGDNSSPRGIDETSAPTMAPTPSPVVGWTTISANRFSSPRTGSGLGTAVALAGNTLVLGLPAKRGKGEGSINTYAREAGARSFNSTKSLQPEDAELFGFALDLVQDPGSSNIFLAVGAPRTNGLESNATRLVSFGSVHIYRMGSTGSTWYPVGNTIRSTETLEESGSLFGDAVALARDIRRVAVAAPSRSTSQSLLNDGAVMVYELQINAWVPMMTVPLRGDEESYFGSSVDLSADGEALLVGAPGGGTSPGKVAYYRWNSSSWGPVFEEDGTGIEEKGRKVTFLNDEGTVFAFGMPNRLSNRGAVRVMMVNGTDFIRMGNDITGTSFGDYVGRVICAKNSRIAIGTARGDLRVYDFTNSTWQLVGDSPNVGSAITSCAMSDDSKAVVIGTVNEQVSVYDLS